MELPRYVLQQRHTSENNSANTNFAAVSYYQILEQVMEVYNSYLRLLGAAFAANSSNAAITHFFNFQNQITRNPNNVAFVMGIMAIKNEGSKINFADQASIVQCQNNIFNLIGICQQNFTNFDSLFQKNDALVSLSDLLYKLFDQLKLRLNEVGSPHLPQLNLTPSDNLNNNAIPSLPRAREAESAQDEQRARVRPRTK